MYDNTKGNLITDAEVVRSVEIAKGRSHWRFKLCGFYDTKDGCKHEATCNYVHAMTEWTWGSKHR